MTFNMWGVEEKLLPQSRPSTFMSQTPLNIALMGGGVPCAFLPHPGPGQSRAGEWLERVTLVAGLQNQSCEEFDGTVRLANCQFVPLGTWGNGPSQPWTPLPLAPGSAG